MNKKIAPFVVLVFILLFAIFAYVYAKNSASKAVDFHIGEYSGADKCQECHQENYDSWKQTYHRSMTQEATEESVLGQFDNSEQTYWGITIRPNMKDGKFYFSYYDPKTGTHLNTLEIKRTVGSRRYQQYLAQTENTAGNYYRLELLWHILDQRWVHLNGAFLGSDHQAFDNHTGIWNQNCIFCHNTGIHPNMTNYDEIVELTKTGRPLNLNQDSRFESSVSDLGIGCESCHANGQEHIELNQNPIRKYYLHYSEDDDKSIINPAKLSAKRAMDVCGQCHGQRTPKSFDLARKWMEQGPTYRPGDALQTHVNPVLKESQINTRKSDMFKQRFWKDGTPRLSAYEYQGLLQSQCHIKGDLTCNDCHSMHDGDPKGMITEENRSNAACFQCHEDYKNTLTEHTGHQQDSDGSLCYNCHMPKIVYGVMTFHRSHKIESPNPVAEFANDKPNACAACHIDKTDDWIIAESLKLWPNLQNAEEFSTSNIISAIYKLHSGDPAERAIAASNLSYKSRLINSDDKKFLIPHLLFAMEDSYPAIRRFAFKSLSAIIEDLALELDKMQDFQNALKTFDFITDVDNRSKVLINAWNIFNSIDHSNWNEPPTGALLDGNYLLDMNSILQLRELSQLENKVIDIGE
jgi:predicted CXXCH cytochrome family protein